MTLTDIPRPKYWTYEDVQALPEDGKRHEVIDGVLIVSPAPVTMHQIVSTRLQFFLYQLQLQGKGYVFDAPTDLIMPGCTPVQPDLIFLLPDQFDCIKERFIEGCPHVVVEILSPSTARVDRVRKLRKFAKNGVPYYLLADHEAATLEVLELDGEHYRLVHSLEPGDSWEFQGLTLDIAQLFASLKRPDT